MLEDDDYSRRAREAGYRLVCAEDAFVHHFGETSFGKLVADRALRGATRRRTSAASRRSGASRGSPTGAARTRSTRTCSARVRQVVADELPDGAHVLVVSRGDEQLLRLEGRPARHFPEAADGSWAGHHPGRQQRGGRRARGDARARRASSSCSPAPACGGSTTTRACSEHLDSRYEAVVRDEHVCVIYALNGAAVVSTPRCSIVIPVHGRAGPHAPLPGGDPQRSARRPRSRSWSSTTPPRTRRPRCSRARASRCARCGARRRAASRPRATTAPRRRAESCSCSSTTTPSHSRAGSTRWSRMRTRIPRRRSWGRSCCSPTARVQHAGVAICQDGGPRHLYAGFPADHPAVDRERAVPGRDRRLHAGAPRGVRAGRRVRHRVSQLARGRRPVPAHPRAGSRGALLPRERGDAPRVGVPRARLGRRAAQLRPLPEAVGRARAHRDDLDHYAADGLLRLRYRDTYPIGIETAPELASALGSAGGG